TFHENNIDEIHKRFHQNKVKNAFFKEDFQHYQNEVELQRKCEWMRSQLKEFNLDVIFERTKNPKYRKKTLDKFVLQGEKKTINMLLSKVNFEFLPKKVIMNKLILDCQQIELNKIFSCLKAMVDTLINTIP